eukprot:scaffold73069_cov41-Cyclotella_meneghiniana.AAC.2
MGIWDLKWTSQRDFSVAGGVKVGLTLVYFPCQDCVSLDRFGQFTAQPLQYLILGIMNGCARLRFEFIVHNHHHAPAFELGLDDSSGYSTLRFTPRWSIFELIQEFHSFSTLPTSQQVQLTDEESGDGYMGIWDLKWTSQRDFSVAGGVKVGLALVHFPGQDCVSLD